MNVRLALLMLGSALLILGLIFYLESAAQWHQAQVFVPRTPIGSPGVLASLDSLRKMYYSAIAIIVLGIITAAASLLVGQKRS